MDAFIALITEEQDGRFAAVVLDTETEEVHAVLLPADDEDAFRVADIVTFNICEGFVEEIEGTEFLKGRFESNHGPAMQYQAFSYQSPVRQFMQERGWTEDILYEGEDADVAVDAMFAFFERLPSNDGMQ